MPILMAFTQSEGWINRNSIAQGWFKPEECLIWGMSVREYIKGSEKGVFHDKLCRRHSK
jgi:hypothetical protein